MGERSSLVSESWSQDLPVELYVVCLKKKNKKMTQSLFCRFPLLTLTGCSRGAGILILMDKRPLQKHRKLSKSP